MKILLLLFGFLFISCNINDDIEKSIQRALTPEKSDELFTNRL